MSCAGKCFGEPTDRFSFPRCRPKRRAAPVPPRSRKIAAFARSLRVRVERREASIDHIVGQTDGAQPAPERRARLEPPAQVFPPSAMSRGIMDHLRKDAGGRPPRRQVCTHTVDARLTDRAAGAPPQRSNRVTRCELLIELRRTCSLAAPRAESPLREDSRTKMNVES